MGLAYDEFYPNFNEKYSPNFLFAKNEENLWTEFNLFL